MDAIEKRAIELYRKQRLEPWSIPHVSGGLVDLISSSSKKPEEEEGKEPVEKLDDPIPEETLNSGTLIPSDVNEMELVSDKIPNDSITMDVERNEEEEEEEGGATGISNKVSVPLVVESGEALVMPESGEGLMMLDSDESKMVNLSSRIQQSPESTH